MASISVQILIISCMLSVFATALLSWFLSLRTHNRLRTEHDKAVQGLNAALQQSQSEHAAAQAEQKILREQIEDLRQRLQNSQLEQDTWRRRAHEREQDAKIAATRLEEKEKHFQQQINDFQQQKLLLKQEFENVANRIFEEKGKNFSATNQTALDQLLKPFREQIEGFQKRVNEVHTESVQGQGQLQQQIKSLLEVGLRMSDEANSLASALKSDKKAQGNWSEIQAELLLEASGLRAGHEYQREASIKNDEGREQRPDFIINLPNDKHIILDSKISLNAYVRAVSTSDDVEREKCMQEHVAAIRAHVKSLSEKNYTKLKGVNSPEFVFMFVGNEPAYLAAFDCDPSLFQEAHRKGIAIVTPSTLLASLKIVSHLWAIDKQNSNTRQLAEQASKVYDKLRVFLTKMDTLGTQLDTVQKTYDEGLRSLRSGKGNLVSQVEKFVEMGVSVKEKLPGTTADQSENDVD